MSHTILTFITRVTPARQDELAQLLEQIRASAPDHPALPFRALDRLHFASLVLFEDATYGTYLVFEHNFDGGFDEYLAELYQHAADGLHQIYQCCAEYPVADAGDRAAMLGYLRRHVVRPAAYHIGNVGRTARQIRQEQELREALETLLDEWLQEGLASGPPDEIRGRLQAAVSARPEWKWALQHKPRQTQAEQLLPWVKIGAVLAGGLGLIGWGWRWLLPAVGAYVAVLRWKESTDATEPSTTDPDALRKLRQLTAREDETVQNHLASLIHVKPGLFRGVTLRVVLFATNLVARTATSGQLSGIPSIHFAHWALVDNGRRLLFLSNYDGSWENYLDDFIDKASQGLTGIWSNTVYFPATRFLILAGARDGPRFKAWARDAQSYTAVHYSAYDQLTVQTIDNNSALREGLSDGATGADARGWLRRF
jgi:hypothetical protein